MLSMILQLLLEQHQQGVVFEEYFVLLVAGQFRLRIGILNETAQIEYFLIVHMDALQLLPFHQLLLKFLHEQDISG